MENLEKGRIKVSLLNHLNDPFEMLPNLRHETNDVKKEIMNIHKRVSMKWGLLCFTKYNCPTKNRYDNCTYHSKHKLDKNIKEICFNSWHEPLLWSHYADRHKGVALGFELNYPELKKIKYTKNLRQRIKLTDNLEDNEKTILDLAKTKHHSWQYEKEYRLLVNISKLNPEKGNYFVGFSDQLKLKEIILGCKFNGDLMIILNLAKKYNAEVIPTRKEWQGFRIQPCGTGINKIYKLLK